MSGESEGTLLLGSMHLCAADILLQEGTPLCRGLTGLALASSEFEVSCSAELLRSMGAYCCVIFAQHVFD